MMMLLLEVYFLLIIGFVALYNEVRICGPKEGKLNGKICELTHQRNFWRKIAGENIG